jgi:SEC-C motif domain protein
VAKKPPEGGTQNIFQMNNCYCCSDKTFADCCQPFLEGAAKPPTAEALMRSRYSAYAMMNVEYLLKSTHPSTRKFHDPEELENWAKANSWQKLEIISTIEGDKKGVVEFKAFYLDSNSTPQIHHEISNFQKELGKWFFVDGKNAETHKK